MEDLWKIRQRKQMTVAQLSAKAGIPARLIQEYESSRRPISMENLEKLARALFVDPTEIKPLSAPLPAETAYQPARVQRDVRERPPQSTPPPPTRTVSPRPARPPQQQQQLQAAQEAQGKLAARESQVKHLQMLGERFGWNQSELEREISTPLGQLTRAEASRWLKQLQERIATERPQKTKRRRPYLPESVDSFEFDYLQEQQRSQSPMEFTLFNGQKLQGKIMGFGPYNITIESDQGELTLNKLAIAYYGQVEQKEAR